jgi:GntP family gluconate:H+ symporter
MDPIVILLVGISVILVSIILLKLHPFISLLLSAIVVAILTPESNLIAYFVAKGLGSEEAMKMSHKSVGERIAVEFGNTCTKIGILIAMAAIIGKSMLESGAAEKIIRSMLRVLGTRNAPFGFALSSFFLTIPVFVDTVIFLMMPLAKAMALKLKKNYFS